MRDQNNTFISTMSFPASGSGVWCRANITAGEKVVTICDRSWNCWLWCCLLYRKSECCTEMLPSVLPLIFEPHRGCISFIPRCSPISAFAFLFHDPHQSLFFYIQVGPTVHSVETINFSWSEDGHTPILCISVSRAQQKLWKHAGDQLLSCHIFLTLWEVREHGENTVGILDTIKQ